MARATPDMIAEGLSLIEQGKSLRAAARAGVEIFALGARVTSRAIRVERGLPVLL